VTVIWVIPDMAVGSPISRSATSPTTRCPWLVAAFCEHAEAILDGLDEGETWEAVIGAEPALAVRLSEEGFDQALVAVADFVDLKSPYTLGHARGVSELAYAAGMKLCLGATEVAMLRRAALVSGLGRLGVSNATWDKRAPLGAGERERVRMHPYLTDRMLHQSVALAPPGAIAMQLRERIDGSGYPKGLAGAAISLSARILGAADAYQAMCEPRPYRDALAAEQAVRELRAEVKAGQMDGDVVEAVLGAAGHRVARRRVGPAGLTTREVDVLRLVARGPFQQGGGVPVGDLPEDGPQPHRAHLFQDRRVEPGRGGSVRHAARPSPRRGSRAGIGRKDGAIAP
jgi:HD domain